MKMEIGWLEKEEVGLELAAGKVVKITAATVGLN